MSSSLKQKNNFNVDILKQEKDSINNSKEEKGNNIPNEDDVNMSTNFNAKKVMPNEEHNIYEDKNVLENIKENNKYNIENKKNPFLKY